MPRIIEIGLDPQRIALTGIDRIWEATRRASEALGAFSAEDVQGDTQVKHVAIVRNYLRKLVAAGIAAEAGWSTGERRYRQRLYRLVASPRATPHLLDDGQEARQGRRTQQMWNILRGPQARRGINATELALLAATEATPVPVPTAKLYLHALYHADVVILVRPAVGGPHGQPAVYKLRANSSPMAPRVLRGRLVYDPATRRILNRQFDGEVEL